MGTQCSSSPSIASEKALPPRRSRKGVVLDLVDKPKLAVSVPRSRAALAHIMRPFPGVALQALKPFLWFGERQRRKTAVER